MLTPEQERMWAIGIILVCTLIFGAYAVYEIVRPEKPATTTTTQSR